MSTTRDPDCLFCSIVAEQVPATVVGSSEHSLAFRDLNPQAPTHVLVIPRRHVSDAESLAAASGAELADVVALAGRIADDEGLRDGYRLVFNTGADAGQTVFHAHLHVLGGRGMTWPPG